MPDTRRLLLVTHRAIDQAGGATARWRSLVRRLPPLGWEVDVVSAPVHPTSAEYATEVGARRRVAVRAAVMEHARGLASPAFRTLGIRPPPLSTLWAPRGAHTARQRLRVGRHDVIVATGPPMIALVAARLAALRTGCPLVLEFRDLWAGNPAYDAGGQLLGSIESWLLRGAARTVVCTPEAREHLGRLHPGVAPRLALVPNGFEDELLERRTSTPAQGILEILHSGTVLAHRPLEPLLEVLSKPPFAKLFRLTLHGFISPGAAATVRSFRGRCQIVIVPTSTWEDAVGRMVRADATLITQSRASGDDTAVATKIYEYLALGKPVLATTHGGATEAMLKRLGAGTYCARLDDRASIAAALTRLLEEPRPTPIPAKRLAPYARSAIAKETACLLDNTRLGWS